MSALARWLGTTLAVVRSSKVAAKRRRAGR